MDYRRMGNMELDMGNTTSSHHSRNLWGSPRWTVIRIQALALVSIILSFLLANFGSCRRWSNRWLVQKGFFAAHVLSLSLGTYSIGLMQSSSVKSEMYPIWTVSLFTLFGCIDPVNDYIGLDYKGPLSKVVYGICLNFGYVLVITISTISSVVGNTAIGMLSAITFIKGFHRSLALMQQRRIRNMVLNSELTRDFVVDVDEMPTGDRLNNVTLVGIEEVLEKLEGVQQRQLRSCYDVCVAYALSHQLQGYFLGVRDVVPDPEVVKCIIMKCGGYNWFLEVIDTELAFMYEVFFTGNPFLHYYQAKTASLWALASFMGICFVGVAAGTMSSHGSGSTKVLDTTTADLAITFGILVSLALLQLLHLIRCWTSNWAKVAVACTYTRQAIIGRRGEDPGCWWTWWVRLKTFVATSTNWFDKYLWQDQIGQYSMLPDGRKFYLLPHWCLRMCVVLVPHCCFRMCMGMRMRITSNRRTDFKLYRGGARLAKMLGLDYISEVLQDLLGSDTSKTSTVRLDHDVKTSINEFLVEIKSNRLEGSWFSFCNYPSIEKFLPYCKDPKDELQSRGHIYTSCVTMWYTATRYCELIEEKTWRRAGAGAEQNAKRGVAIALSKYCAYLVVSAPELLPGLALDTKRTYDTFVEDFSRALQRFDLNSLMSDPDRWASAAHQSHAPKEFSTGMNVGNLLLGVPKDQWSSTITDITRRRRSDPWETLALVWVRLLIYAAPYGDAEVHKHRLAHGGELITHLWALLFHLGIREWKHPEEEENITTMDHAEKILTEDDRAVIAFLDSLSGHYNDELVAAAAALRREGDVKVYTTLGPEIAKRFDINPAAKCPALVLVNKYGRNKFTLYDGEFLAPEIARFVSDVFCLVEQLPNKTKLHNITSIDGADKILTEDDLAVVAFLNSLSGHYNDELVGAAAMTRHYRDVTFYVTLGPQIAKRFDINPVAKCPALVLLNKKGENQFTLYDGEFRAEDIVGFVFNTIRLAEQVRAHSSEAGGQTENRIIEEEITPGS